MRERVLGTEPADEDERPHARRQHWAEGAELVLRAVSVRLGDSSAGGEEAIDQGSEPIYVGVFGGQRCPVVRDLRQAR